MTDIFTSNQNTGRDPNAQGPSPLDLLQRQNERLMEFLRSFIAGSTSQDFRPWGRQLYRELYSGTPETKTSGWQPIETAPKDKPIVGWCVHSADPYWASETHLTTYGAHAEGLGHADDGPNIIVWGGEYHENDWESGVNAHIDAWWFVDGSDWEKPANPTHWMPLPADPSAQETKPESHYCIDCNDAHDPRTCGALGPSQKASAPDWVTITVQCAHCGAFASSPESCDHTVGCPTLQVNGKGDEA